MVSPGDDRYQTAGALAPFLAEHYYATGQDLADAAAADDKILVLAAAYARLPALAQQAGEAAAQTDPSVEGASAEQLRWRQVDALLNETAIAIRHRLSVLAGQPER